MDQIKDMPEAKYVMDDLMARTYKSEQQLIRNKGDSIILIHRIIRDVSALQIQSSGSYLIDKDQLSKKDDAITNLIKLVELNIK